MEILILIITLAAVTMLVLGFTGITIPVLQVPFHNHNKRISRHNRKMIRKRMWYNSFHKGFITLPTTNINRIYSGKL